MTPVQLFITGCSSKFRVGSSVRQTPEEDRRTYRQKHCGNNHKEAYSFVVIPIISNIYRFVVIISNVYSFVADQINSDIYSFILAQIIPNVYSFIVVLIFSNVSCFILVLTIYNLYSFVAVLIIEIFIDLLSLIGIILR